jgi:hypothetical protein
MEMPLVLDTRLSYRILVEAGGIEPPTGFWRCYRESARLSCKFKAFYPFSGT